MNGGGHANGDSVSESEGGTHRPAGNGSQSDAGAQPEPQGSAGNEGAEKKISLGGIIKAAQATVSDSLPPTLSQPLVDRNSFQEKMEGMAATTLHNRVPIQRSTSEREVGMSVREPERSWLAPELHEPEEGLPFGPYTHMPSRNAASGVVWNHILRTWLTSWVCPAFRRR